MHYRFGNIKLYADDIILLASTVSALQKMLGICSDYARGHNIEFNSSKSVCMRFGRDITKVAYYPNIYWEGYELSWVDSYCCLFK